MPKLTYAKATERLNEILQQIEQEQLDIDTLTDTIKEAKQLIKFCKERLYKVDQEIKEIMDDNEE